LCVTNSWQIVRKLTNICSEGNDKLRALKGEHPELNAMLNPSGCSALLSSINLDQRNLAAHPDLEDVDLLHDILEMERTTLDWPWDEYQFVALDRNNIKLVLIVLGKEQSTSLLGRIQSEKRFASVPEGQLVALRKYLLPDAT